MEKELKALGLKQAAIAGASVRVASATAAATAVAAAHGPKRLFDSIDKLGQKTQLTDFVKLDGPLAEPAEETPCVCSVDEQYLSEDVKNYVNQQAVKFTPSRLYATKGRGSDLVHAAGIASACPKPPFACHTAPRLWAGVDAADRDYLTQVWTFHTSETTTADGPEFLG